MNLNLFLFYNGYKLERERERERDREREREREVRYGEEVGEQQIDRETKRTGQQAENKTNKKLLNGERKNSCIVAHIDRMAVRQTNRQTGKHIEGDV